MAHHSSSQFDGDISAFRDAFLGPTGKYPQGKLTPKDEGEIRIAVGSKDGKVVMDFGKPTAWIGMDPEQADAIADSLREHARAARG